MLKTPLLVLTLAGAALLAGCHEHHVRRGPHPEPRIAARPAPVIAAPPRHHPAPPPDFRRDRDLPRRPR